MDRAWLRLRCALWLPLLLAVGCQPVREDRSINFQKNGAQVAFQHGKNGVFIGDQDGGPPKKIFQPADDVIAASSPLWSPTDKRLIFTTAKKADAQAKSERRLGGDADPAGKLHLATPTTYTCWLREEEKDGKAPPPAALFDAACDHPGYVAANLAVRWHPDGKSILFVKQTDARAHAVFEFDLQTKKSRQVFKRTAEAVVFDWAPDNAHLVCVLGSNSQPRETDGVWIGTPAADDWWHVPESSTLAQGELPAVLEQLRATRPIWSRQGERFVFVSSQAKDAEKKVFVHHLHLGTPATRTIANLATGPKPVRDVRWSPNGDHIGYVAGAAEGPLTFFRLIDKASSTLVPNARAFLGWDEKNASLAYVVPEPIPHGDSAAWVFLLTPNPRYRDALWLAPADGSAPGRKVFSGMQITFPQWSPKDSKVSLWATFNPSYRARSSILLDLLGFAAKFGLRVRPGDPALVLDPESGKLDWMAIDGHEQIQVGHCYQMKREYEAAWQWYEKANKTGKPESVRESLFFQHYCLSKLGRDAEAKEKLAQFEREFWSKLPQIQKDGAAQGLTGLIRALTDPKSPLGIMVRDLYIAEVFLSLDAAEDGETHFRDALKNATTDTVLLDKAVLFSQFLLLAKKHGEYLDLVNTTLLPLVVGRDALPVAAGGQDEEWLSQLSDLGWQLAVLPLCDPEFVKSLNREETQSSLVRLEDVREKARNDKQRFWLDAMMQTGHQRLGQPAQADAAAKRIAANPEHLDAADRIAAVRQLDAETEKLRKMLQLHQ